MNNKICCILIAIALIAGSRVFADDTSSNTDFNPFPQMEQDLSNNTDESSTEPQEQSDDQWPPANAVHSNSEMPHE